MNHEISYYKVKVFFLQRFELSRLNQSFFQKIELSRLNSFFSKIDLSLGSG